MQELLFTIDINAPSKQVWHTLWDDTTFRQWAGTIDPGTYMVGELQPGGTVQFISSEGYGVTSLITALNPYHSITFQHQADTKDFGTDQRTNEWTGGQERYELHESQAVTTLTLTIDVPTDMVPQMRTSYLQTLKCIKALAEKVA